MKLLITGFRDVVHDTQCGFKLFTREAAEKLFPVLHINRWAFHLELVVLSRVHGLSISEVGVNWTESPGSKLGLVSANASTRKDMMRIHVIF